jgi:hypothetical protein
LFETRIADIQTVSIRIPIETRIDFNTVTNFQVNEYAEIPFLTEHLKREHKDSETDIIDGKQREFETTEH